jgi:photosystem II stability/assembly factor-like uncharacterized protein
MKSISRCLVTLFLTYLFNSNVFSQSHFGNKGLTIGATHFNIYDGVSNQTFRYISDTIVCGEKMFVYERFDPYHSKVLILEKQRKVSWRYINDPCGLDHLLYDFSLNLGETFTATNGIWTVVDTSQTILLNGDTRRSLQLKHNTYAHYIDWVDGIGNLQEGFFWPSNDLDGYSSKFICAKDSTGDLLSGFNIPSTLCDSILCPEPTSRFTYTQNDHEVSFINNSLDTDSWLWDFGDGNTSSEKNPIHEYISPGCYNVLLTSNTHCFQRPFKIYKTININEAKYWEKLTLQLAQFEQLISVSFPHPDTGWVLSNQHIWKTTDGGQTWNIQNHPSTPSQVQKIMTQIRMLDTQRGVISAGHYIYGGVGDTTLSNLMTTNDGGLNWRNTNKQNISWLSLAEFSDNGTGYAFNSSNSVIFTSDYGENWENKATFGFNTVKSIAYLSEDTIIVTGWNGLQPLVTPTLGKSFDKGDTWQWLLYDSLTIAYDAYFFNTQNGWMLGDFGELLHTKDGGMTWERYHFDLLIKPYAIDFVDANNGWVVGPGLILHTVDAGVSWQRENCGAVEGFYDIAAPSSQVAYAVGQLGVYKYCPSDLCTSSTDDGLKENSINTIDKIKIYPNPTHSHFWIESKQDLQIEVFDVLGQAIWTGNLPSGTNQIALPTKIRAGIFFVKTTSISGKSQVEKVILE